jgi:hypothetical protein
VLVDGRLIPLFFVTDTHPGVVIIDPPIGLLDFDEAAEARDDGQISQVAKKTSKVKKVQG